jgi:hypothetical protein
MAVQATRDTTMGTLSSTRSVLRCDMQKNLEQ